MPLTEVLLLPSQNACLRILQSKLALPQSRVLLSGPQGSGKSFICEQVLSLIENSRISSFVPCSPDLTAEQLRELCLRQLFPNFKADFKASLKDNFLKAGASDHADMFLAIDDIDKAPPAFFAEVLALACDPEIGKRLLLLLSASSSWVEARRQALDQQFSTLQEVTIPSLSENEARLIIKSASNKEGSFDYDKAVARFDILDQSRKGNIGEIMRLLDGLKQESAVNTAAFTADHDEALVKTKDKKRKGVFLWLLLIALLLIALIALFGGYSLKDKIFGKQSLEDGAPSSVESVEKPSASSAKPNAKSTADNTDDLLRVSKGAITDLKASGHRGTDGSAQEDQGELLPEVKGAEVDAVSPKNELHGSVTLRGDTLERIERGHLTPKDGAKLESKELDKAEKGDKKTLNEVKKEQDSSKQSVRQSALIQSELKALKPASLGKDLPKVQEHESLKNKAGRYPVGRAVPGGTMELGAKNPGHYTLQIAAGRNRQNVADASAFIAGRYWIYKTLHEGKPWYVLIQGDYLSSVEAKAQLASLPDFLQKTKPFVKTFDTVQREMKQHAN